MSEAWQETYDDEEFINEQDYEEYESHPDVIQEKEEYRALLREGRYRDLPAHFLKYSGWYIVLSTGKTYTIYKHPLTETEAIAWSIGRLEKRLQRLTLNLRRMQNHARQNKVEDMDEYERHWLFRSKAAGGWVPMCNDYYWPNEYKIFDYPLHLLNIRRLQKSNT